MQRKLDLFPNKWKYVMIKDSISIYQYQQHPFFFFFPPTFSVSTSSLANLKVSLMRDGNFSLFWKQATEIFWKSESTFSPVLAETS